MTGAQSAPSIQGEGIGEVAFRQFKLQHSSRRLLRGGQPVDIGSRAFDLLSVLVRSSGTLVTKNAIIRQVWPSTVVEESNLRFQMASLRKVLAEDRDVIKTIPGRGYLFVADVVANPDPAASSGLNLPLKRTVVIIEDDFHVRDALENLLLSSGLDVQSFSSVHAYTNNPQPLMPGCFVLDVWLPGESGLDFQMELARSGMRAPVIFISGHADVPMSVRAMKAGAVEFLTKPVRHEDLLKAIRLATALEAA